MKLCKNCKYMHIVRSYTEFGYCTLGFYCYRLHRKINVSLVTGGSVRKGKILECETARKKERFCGKEGCWFKAERLHLPPKIE